MQFDLRLPSMIIKRDILMHSPSIAAAMMQAAAARAAASPSAQQYNTSIQLSSTPQPSYSPQGNYTFSPPAGGASRSLTPLQQRDMMQREQREKERRILLAKASGSLGGVVEQLMATYLSV